MPIKESKSGRVKSQRGRPKPSSKTRDSSSRTVEPSVFNTDYPLEPLVPYDTCQTVSGDKDYHMLGSVRDKPKWMMLLI